MAKQYEFEYITLHIIINPNNEKDIRIVPTISSVIDNKITQIDLFYEKEFKLSNYFDQPLNKTNHEKPTIYIANKTQRTALLYYMYYGKFDHTNSEHRTLMNELITCGNHYHVTVRDLRKILYDPFQIIQKLDQDRKLEMQGKTAEFLPIDKNTVIEPSINEEPKNEKPKKPTVRRFIDLCLGKTGNNKPQEPKL